MNKIFIVGIVASGKSTLARKMSLQTGIPCFELDSIVHKNTETGRVKQSPDEQRKEIRDIDQTSRWIFEGVYRESYHCLFHLADRIIFLDTPLWKRKIRILTRFVKQKLKIEPCGYRPDFHMLKMMFQWTKDFERNRAGFCAMLDAYREKLMIVSNSDKLIRNI